MPVERFRTLEEAERALQSRSGALDLFKRIRTHWHRVGTFAGRRYPSGVRLYASLEDAEVDRLRWIGNTTTKEDHLSPEIPG